MTEIVDGHHHIWRQADLPWLTGPMQPRIFGPYEPIRRDYPIEEYLDDLERHRRHPLGLRPDQLGQRPFRGRGRLGAADRRRDTAGRTRIVAYRQFRRRRRPPAARPPQALSAGARRAHAAALAREPALSVRGAPRSLRRSRDPPQRRAPRRLRLEL